MRISDIFEVYGETVFRDYESEIVRRCLRLNEVVISTGGGAVTRKENRELLKRRGPVVVLSATPETIYRRTRRNRRPLLEGTDPTARIRSLLDERRAAYEEVATLRICTEDRPSSEVVEEIVQKLKIWKETRG
jgi:shikimate kinase